MDPKALDDLVSADYADRMDEAGESSLPRPGQEDVLVSKTLRLSLPLVEAIREEAERQEVKPSALMRQWIEEGLRRSHGENAAVDVDELVRAIRQLARQSHRQDAA
jgi:predicted transcriptional regulator